MIILINISKISVAETSYDQYKVTLGTIEKYSAIDKFKANTYIS